MPGEVFGFEHGAARRWAELVNRLFGMESADAPLPPGFILELDRPEWQFLKREYAWTTGILTAAANVGNLSRIQVKNPASSGRLIIVTGAYSQAGVAGSYLITRDGSAIVSGVAANLALDTRVQLISSSRKVGSQNAIDNSLPAPSGEQLFRKTGTAGGDVFFNMRAGSGGPELPVILVPNTVCDLICQTANTALVAWMVGYERPFNPDELAA